MAVVAWWLGWHARAAEGFALDGAWLDDRMARVDGAIYWGRRLRRRLCWWRETDVSLLAGP